jgi:glycosyltransferase involved in cell wall biosynthesis
VSDSRGDARGTRVSIVVPAYNVAPYLADAIDSVLAQTHAAHEIIVVDDGSPDASADIASRYGARVRLIRQRNRGIGAARNRGAAAATGDWLVFLDGDDVLEPDALAKQLDVAYRNPESVLVAGDGEQFNDEGVVAPSIIGGPLAARLALSGPGELSGRFHLDLIAHNAFTTTGQAMVARAAFESVGGFLQRREWSEDWDMWLRLSRRWPVTLHRGRVLRYRVRSESLSGADAERPIRWSIWRVPVIRRHLADASAEERVALLSRLDGVVREGAREAYYFGRHRNRARALRYLWRLSIRARWHAAPLRNLVALALPDAVVAAIARSVRALRADSGRSA